MDAKKHRIQGQLKRKPADFKHIFSVSTLEAILLLRHAFFWKDMYDVHRFDARNILWHMGILLYDAEQFYVKNKMAAE